MDIQAESAISIKITKDEVRDILLDHVKRVAGGVIKKDMELVDTNGEFNDLTFFWTQTRVKAV